MQFQGWIRLCIVFTAVPAMGLHLAGAQDPTEAFPRTYQVLLENDAVSVIRVHYGLHEKVGVHDHSAYPTVYVYLSDPPPLRFTHDEQLPFA